MKAHTQLPIGRRIKEESMMIYSLHFEENLSFMVHYHLRVGTLILFKKQPQSESYGERHHTISEKLCILPCNFNLKSRCSAEIWSVMSGQSHRSHDKSTYGLSDTQPGSKKRSHFGYDFAGSLYLG